MTLTLRRPTDAEYAAWSRVALEEYIDEMVASGSMSRRSAAEKARTEDAELLSAGLDTPGQLIFRVEGDGQPVGWLWFGLQQPKREQGVGFIYDISIDEAFRGRGYGRAAMKAAEEEARRRGLTALVLNVFGQNAVARSLYTRLGYRETSVQMRKEL
ncbi:MAG: GNAT family N-acetyltransferase [Candidatus Dormibacteraeota bacterium]|uniref:N-acetyltransferase n=1 Tax=Candidatus Aeolococcus gillhamiae TaxID=3127015 RepID=A0A2W5YYX8_9BACT|nr:GNAT family N-acetyltransferase [Candidatus Dormibacteraeota bacterium]PZR78209.1 MAG: N-acetyltransferase [Candidatus Dormibacter sp. RRmetagenome_bin12]